MKLRFEASGQRVQEPGRGLPGFFRLRSLRGVRSTRIAEAPGILRERLDASHVGAGPPGKRQARLFQFVQIVRFLERNLMPCRRRFSEQQHAHCRPSHRGTWSFRDLNWMLYHCCVCSASSAATRVHGYNGSNLRGWQCCWASFGWCFHGSCLLAMVVCVYPYSARA